IGLEYREESYSDNRDPRLDGTLQYVADNGSEFPFVSDVLGSSPTTDSVGDKNTTSIFAEFQIPVTERIDAQLAFRHEDISDAGTTSVGKLAVGWNATDWLLLRGSAQTATRAPNLVQVNQAQVARFGSRVDAVYQYITENNTTTASGMDSDSKYTIQRFATGAENLESEKSKNSSIGFVIQPPMLEGLTVTYDAWKIVKDKTIGLFGRDNHTVLDLAMLLESGNSNCGSSVGNSSVIRDEDELDAGVIALFETAGICPVGRAYRVTDEYINMAKRTLEGQDIGIKYDFETSFGEFGIRYNASFTDTFKQVPTGDFSTIQAAQASGAIPSYVNLKGFGNLLGIDGAYDEKHSAKLLWRKGDWGGSLTGLRKGDFIQSSLTLSDGTEYVVPSMTTMDASVYYRFKLAGTSARIKLAVKNLADERAPTADRFFGFFADAHQDYGRNYYLSLKVDM
ncbi:MAG: TonB-dependent receptor, partial [Porticoccaceae bacterium]|nr:TonB-dependent receptor [Porticoccaceae bacterium]